MKEMPLMSNDQSFSVSGQEYKVNRDTQFGTYGSVSAINGNVNADMHVYNINYK